MLFLKRRLKPLLDLIQPKSEEVAKQKILKQFESDKGREQIKFKVNQKVATLGHRHNDKKWVVGTINSVFGHLMYTERIAKDVVWKRNHNQIIPMPDENSSLTDVPLPQIIDNKILQARPHHHRVKMKTVRLILKSMKSGDIHLGLGGLLTVTMPLIIFEWF